MSSSTINLFSSSLARIIAQARIPLYRNAYALTLSDAISNGLGIVYWIIAARFYAASDVGLNSAMLETMMFLSGISQLNLSGALIRFIPSAGSATNRLV